MALNTVKDLLEDQLKDLFSAENQLIKALPKMAKKASSQALADGMLQHLDETRVHVERLQQIGEIMDIKLSGKVCMAMKGLVEEGNEVLQEDGQEQVLDLGIIAAAQRVEHYEIAAYGTARALAERLGLTDVVGILQQTLDEEGETDKKLTSISEGELLPTAPTDESEEGEDDEDEGSGNGRSRSGNGKSKSGSRGGSSSGKKSGAKAKSGGRR